MRSIEASGDHFTEIPLLLFVFAIDDHGRANIYPATWSGLLATRADAARRAQRRGVVDDRWQRDFGSTVAEPLWPNGG
ncbi:MAG TPA: hypothetical protein VGM75_06760 [Pseudonocardiaceae bacterium]